MSDQRLVIYSPTAPSGTSATGPGMVPVSNSAPLPVSIANSSVVIDNGAATSAGTTTTLTDTAKSWQTNELAGLTISYIVAGVEYSSTIASNTATTVTFATMAVAPASGSSYQIKQLGNETLPVTLSAGIVANLTSAASTANTNIMGSNFTGAATQMSELAFNASVAGVLSVMIDGVAWVLNNGNALVAGNGYTFDVPILSGSTYNLQLSVAATVQVKWVAGVS